MQDIRNPGRPGIYQFYALDGTKDYLRKWDGTYWLYGKRTNSTIQEVADRKSSPISNFDMQSFIEGLYTVKLVANLDGTLVSELADSSHVQLDLF